MPKENEIIPPILNPLASIPPTAIKLETGTKPANPVPGVAIPSPAASAASVAADSVGSVAAARRAGQPGRHKANCDCEKCKAGVTNRRAQTVQPVRPAVKPGSPQALPVSAPPPLVITPQQREMGREAISAATHLMDSAALLLVTMAAKKKGIDGKGLDEITEKVSMTKETRNGIADSGAVVLEKYNALRFAPEVALGLFVSGWLSGILMLVVSINRLPEKAETAEPPKA